MSWTDARTERLKSMWRNERLSANEIAIRLETTRNAVIAKLHRMGLSSADGGSQKQPSGGGRRARGTGAAPRVSKPKPKTWRDGATHEAAVANERKVVEPYRDPPSPRIYDPAKMVRTLDLENHHCRFPVGDPLEESFRHCGETKAPGIPYCIKCAEIAYRPPNVNATGG